MQWFDRNDEKIYYSNIVQTVARIIIVGTDIYRDIRHRFGNLQELIDSEGATLLHYSAEEGDAIVTQWLLDYGLSVDCQTKDGETPLMLAVKHDNEDVVKVLLKANAKIEIYDKYGKTILETISIEVITYTSVPGALLTKFLDKCETVEKAAEKLFDANCSLYLVAFLKNGTILEYFLKKRIDVNSRDSFNDLTALHVAVHFHDLESVELLLEHGADVNAKDSLGWAPVAYLRKSQHCKDEQLAIFETLLNRGADWAASIESSGHMQIHSVLCRCNKKVIDLVLQTNVDVDMKDGAGNTFLHYLVCNDNFGTLELLQNKIFDVNARNNEGTTPLEIATWIGNARAVKFLLDHRADVNSQNNYGDTPLFSAMMCQSTLKQGIKCVELLLQYGAEAQFVNSKELTIFDVVLEYKNFDLVRPVLAHLAVLEAIGTVIKKEICIKMNSDSRLIKPFNLCKKQLEQFKKTVIFESVTIFKLLTESEQKLQLYLRNQQLLLNLDHVDYKINQGYYCQKLRERLDNGLKKLQLKQRAAGGLSKIMQFSYESYPIIIDQIFSYLAEQDLLNLAEHLNIYEKKSGKGCSN